MKIFNQWYGMATDQTEEQALDFSCMSHIHLVDYKEARSIPDRTGAAGITWRT